MEAIPGTHVPYRSIVPSGFHVVWKGGCMGDGESTIRRDDETEQYFAIFRLSLSIVFESMQT